jgi:hypothetical protein
MQIIVLINDNLSNRDLRRFQINQLLSNQEFNVLQVTEYTCIKIESTNTTIIHLTVPKFQFLLRNFKTLFTRTNFLLSSRNTSQIQKNFSIFNLVKFPKYIYTRLIKMIFHFKQIEIGKKGIACIDFYTFLSAPIPKIQTRNLIVDSSLHAHPDIINSAIYAQLDKSFFENLYSSVIKELQLKEVVISIHPRVSEIYDNITCTQEDTASLIKGAETIIFINSWSIQYAIMANKPFFITYNDVLNNLWLDGRLPGPHPKFFIEYFNGIEIDTNESFKIFLISPTTRYKDFFDEFIGLSKAGNLWEDIKNLIQS